MHNYLRLLILIIVCGICCSFNNVKAYVLWSLDTGWYNYAFKAQDLNPTINFYGLGLGSQLSYRMYILPLRMAIWGNYVSGSFKKANLLVKNSWVVKGGLGFGIEIYDLLMEIRLGQYLYDCKVLDQDYVIEGQWIGLGGAGVISVTFNQSTDYFWKISMGVDYSPKMSQKKSYIQSVNSPTRAFNMFFILLNYNYIVLGKDDYDSYSSLKSKNIISSFLKSLKFW